MSADQALPPAPSSLAGALRGVRVLDASRVLAGPFAGQVLADLGAEVIKVEQPGSGDETRQWGPPFADDGLSAYFLACNRGKRSVTLDLKKPAGRELFLRLAAVSDVVIENFRGASATALGLTPADLLAVNPRLVTVSISGFGRGGADGERPGYDFVVQGLSGMMAATGPVAGPPSKFGVAIADLATALYAVVAALAGLRLRDERGQGVAVELALLDCATATMANVAQAYLTSGTPPSRQGNAHLQIVPYEAFSARDGWLVLAVGNDAQFQRFAAVAGLSEVARDERFATNAARVVHRDALLPMIRRVLATRSVTEWTEALTAAQVPAGPVWDLDMLYRSDMAAARGLRLEARLADGTAVSLVGSPLVKGLVPSAPPSLGEQTDAVLFEVLGLDQPALAQLRRDGIV